MNITILLLPARNRSNVMGVGCLGYVLTGLDFQVVKIINKFNKEPLNIITQFDTALQCSSW